MCVCRDKASSGCQWHRDPCVQSFRKIQIEYGLDYYIFSSEIILLIRHGALGFGEWENV